MFAAQLLRVLETVPPNSSDNIRTAVDMVEQEANMNENQNWATFDDNDEDEFWKHSEFEWDNDLHRDKMIQENGFENKNSFVASPMVSANESESLKESDLCADDKNVTECELPELVVFYRENLIKDICVDDGVPSKEMILTYGENFKSFGSEPEVKIELEIQSLTSEVCEYLTKNDYDSVIGYTNEVNHYESGKRANEVLSEKPMTGDKRLSGKLSEPKCLKTLFDSRSSDGSDVENLSYQINHPKVISEIPAECSPDDDPNKGISDLSYNSKTDSGTITFDFNSNKLESEIMDESLNNKNNAHEQSLELNGLPTQDSKIYNNLAHENKVQFGQGESSFSMAGVPVSGIVTHSGSIPYSGSISIRSDSSTTSVRSFAFPILPNEWNSSPVRMAKADRRRYKNAKGWRNGLFCCRF